jgi:hypothetical protein
VMMRRVAFIGKASAKPSSMTTPLCISVSLMGRPVRIGKEI